MPHEDIKLRQFFTVSGLNRRSPVVGHTPALASVAATTESCSLVTSMEQHSE